MTKRSRPPIESADVTDVLHDLDNGSVHQQLDDMLHEVVRAVQDTKKAGSVTLKIDVKLNERGTMLVVKGTVGSKIPRTAAESTLFYGTEDGALVREDPRQMSIKSVVHGPAQPIRDPAAERRLREAAEAIRNPGDGTVVSVGVNGGPMRVVSDPDEGDL